VTRTARHRSPSALSLRGWAVVAVLLSAALNAAGVFSEEEIHWLNLALGLGFAAIAAAAVFGLVARRAYRNERSAWRTGVLLAVLALLTVPAFWSGLPPVFAVAAVALGLRALTLAQRPSSRRGGVVAVTLGGLAIALDVVAYATDIASRL
jgi:ABC-type dipeptide/oligopeptide/nickel transport system permease component